MNRVERKESNIKKYVFITLLVLALSVVFFIMYKYHVEGEKKIPFEIKQIIVVSSAETDDIELNENGYSANVIQKNDLYFLIEKNEKSKKQDAIKKITFSNFSIIEKSSLGNTEIYRTAASEKKYEYNNESYLINDGIEFSGDLNTNLKMEDMTIANQGGLLEFSIILKDLGKINYTVDEKISSDGTLLKRLDIEEENIKETISFDMTMELASGITYKTNIIVETPVGNILENGVCTVEKTDLNKLVYKRV